MSIVKSIAALPANFPISHTNPDGPAAFELFTLLINVLPIIFYIKLYHALLTRSTLETLCSKAANDNSSKLFSYLCRVVSRN